MICVRHSSEIEYLCRSTVCNYEPLCRDCRQSHIATHLSSQNELVPIRNALMQADDNLRRQEAVLNGHLKPLINKHQILLKVKEQKSRLQEQCRRIVAAVELQFSEYIRSIADANRNTFVVGEEEFLEQLNAKMAQIDSQKRLFKTDMATLRKALGFQVNSYLTDFSRTNTPLTNLSHTNVVSLYDEPLTHDFFLSKLELKTRHLHRGSDGMGGTFLTIQPLKKVLNQSPLYFLIQSSTPSPCLYYFFNEENTLKTYDLRTERWYEHRTADMNQEADSIELKGVYYWIGGLERGSLPSKTILFYDSNNSVWGKSSLLQARANPMAVVHAGKILIVGGTANRKSIKSCELFDPLSRTSAYLCDTNFAVSSGLLIAFNDVVFRIGGVNVSETATTSVDIVEKFEAAKWHYVEFQIKGQSEKLFHPNQGGIQVNKNQMMVFGGHDTNLCYLVEVQCSMKQGELRRNKYYARWVNEKSLVSRDDFRGCKPVIWEGSIYSLQNIQRLRREKRLVQFNMYEWFETENIVIT